jgi:hypothetical protein
MSTNLVPCPLCGAESGYVLSDGNPCWWSVQCAACGQETCEARATYPAETTPPTAAADLAWNAAGQHTNRLRMGIHHLEAGLRAAEEQIAEYEALTDMQSLLSADAIRARKSK